jgi:hypothetical protein
MGWAGMLTVFLPMLMQSCQNGASIAKYDLVSTFTNGWHGRLRNPTLDIK